MFFSKLIPLMLVMALDMSFTLAGQPESYWQDYNSCREANPIGKILLSINPACFAVAFVLYSFFILFAAAKLRKPINIVLIAVALSLHVKASASWLPNIFHRVFLAEANEPFLYAGYFLGIAAISIFCFRANNPKPFAPSA